MVYLDVFETDSRDNVCFNMVVCVVLKELALDS